MVRERAKGTPRSKENYKNWEESEYQYLRENWRHQTTKELAGWLGRSPASVYGALRYMGISGLRGLPMETNPWGLDDLELDVLVGVVGGLSNRGIAAFLKLSETSVDIQVQRIQNKMLPKTALSSKDWDKRALLVRKVYREAKGSLLKKMC